MTLTFHPAAASAPAVTAEKDKDKETLPVEPDTEVVKAGAEPETKVEEEKENTSQNNLHLPKALDKAETVIGFGPNERSWEGAGKHIPPVKASAAPAVVTGCLKNGSLRTEGSRRKLRNPVKNLTFADIFRKPAGEDKEREKH